MKQVLLTLKECTNEFKEMVEKESFNNYIIYVGVICFLIILIIFLICKKRINFWLDKHRICESRKPSRTYDNDKKYDAFVQFSPNQPSIIWEYIKELENGERTFKFCYWKLEDLPDKTLELMVASKEIIILLSNEYLKSDLCRINFYLALQATSMDRHKKMIVIKYPDLGDINEYDKHMSQYLDLCTCIDRDDVEFWNKLKLNLPQNSKHDDIMLEQIRCNTSIV